MVIHEKEIPRMYDQSDHYWLFNCMSHGINILLLDRKEDYKFWLHNNYNEISAKFAKYDTPPEAPLGWGISRDFHQAMVLALIDYFVYRGAIKDWEIVPEVYDNLYVELGLDEGYPPYE